jgi:hypothetical protein
MRLVPRGALVPLWKYMRFVQLFPLAAIGAIAFAFCLASLALIFCSLICALLIIPSLMWADTGVRRTLRSCREVHRAPADELRFEGPSRKQNNEGRREMTKVALTQLVALAAASLVVGVLALIGITDESYSENFQRPMKSRDRQ